MGVATRVWFQKHSVEGRMPLLDASYRAHVAAVAEPGTEVRFESLPAATYESSLPAQLVRFGAAEAMFSWHFARQAVVAERGGYDVYVIGTSQDPGLQEARALVDVPVLAYGETAFFTCASAGLHFGVVGFIPELEEPIAENVDRYGLSKWYRGAEYLEGGRDLVEEGLSGEPARFLRAYELACERMVARGARVIVPGEGLPNEILFTAGIDTLAGVPVLDVDGLLVKAAEHAGALRRLGILAAPHEGYRFRPLPVDERDRLFDLFAGPSGIPD